MCIMFITHCTQFSSVSPTTNYVEVFCTLVYNFTYCNKRNKIDSERPTAKCYSAIFINNNYKHTISYIISKASFAEFTINDGFVQPLDGTYN